ncbi:hypothetical protein Tsp_06195 [Trichinella spiralis]|uniref:hypothetical protein n=1 Tax=Trichinella spiralis TaxID=6334 RepID=UPI0001EFBC21|nr:hypothetical protein Tsp_06195 [Trichinella spiralis]
MPSGRGQQMCRTGCLSLKSNTDRSVNMPRNNVLSATNNQVNNNDSPFCKQTCDQYLHIDIFSRMLPPPQSYMNELFSRFSCLIIASYLRGIILSYCLTVDPTTVTRPTVTFKQQLCSATANCASVQNGREQLLLIYWCKIFLSPSSSSHCGE